MPTIALSSGHGLYVRGACGILDEVDEARKVVDRLATELAKVGVTAFTFHDDTSKSQNENLNCIVDWHNDLERELDISVHFNAYEQVSKPMGVEVLYVTQSALAKEVSAAIAGVGFIDRGPKKRTDLFFLNNTDKPAILIEVCFVDSEADCDIYAKEFNQICTNIAAVLSGEEGDIPQPEPEPDVLFQAQGKVSFFGGPDDDGVSPSEGLAFIYSIEDAPHLFLPYQPAGTTGLARRLNPHVHYVACRWNYAVTPKSTLLDGVALVVNVKDPDRALTAFPADWGPNENTGRVADISSGLMEDLGLTTDDEVEVIYPWKGD
jgi:N-acetylmuramoyl-L-alanine amidase